jgi:hypothetical protein
MGRIIEESKAMAASLAALALGAWLAGIPPIIVAIALTSTAAIGALIGLTAAEMALGKKLAEVLWRTYT